MALLKLVHVLILSLSLKRGECSLRMVCKGFKADYEENCVSSPVAQSLHEKIVRYERQGTPGLGRKYSCELKTLTKSCFEYIKSSYQRIALGECRALVDIQKYKDVIECNDSFSTRSSIPTSIACYLSFRVFNRRMLTF